MKQSRISRRNLLTRVSGAILTLWAGRGLAQPQPWVSGMRLQINFELVKGSGSGYRAPFLAVWIENAQGLTIRTLVLWIEQSGGGGRWVNELRRWYRTGNFRETLSGTTRMPGQYSMVWDGKDDKGNLQPQGDYYVCIEKARERGPYELFREKRNLSTTEFNYLYEPDGEIKEVTLKYAK